LQSPDSRFASVYSLSLSMPLPLSVAAAAVCCEQLENMPETVTWHSPECRRSQNKPDQALSLNCECFCSLSRVEAASGVEATSEISDAAMKEEEEESDAAAAAVVIKTIHGNQNICSDCWKSFSRSRSGVSGGR
jgi:hypothetical protein